MKSKTSIFDGPEYVEVKQIKNCKKAGDHYVIQNVQTSEIYLRKTILTSDEKNANTLYTKFANRVQNKSDYLINCEDFSIKIKKDFCSKYYIFRVFYEYPLNDLETLLKEKKNKNEKITHEKLTRIFYEVLEALYFLENNSIGHGHLQNFNIFFSERDNQYKLLDNFSSLKFRDIYLNYIYTNKGYFVFAPETLALIQSGSDELINYSKIDVFHLGLILLMLGNLTPINKLYDLENFIVRKNVLDELLKKFSNRYSSLNPLLVKIVGKLVVLNSNERMLPSELKKKFPTFQKFQNALSRNSSKSDLDHYSNSKESPQNNNKFSQVNHNSNFNQKKYPQKNNFYLNQNDRYNYSQPDVNKNFNQKKNNLNYQNQKKTSTFQIFPDKKDKNFFDF